jgi:uncharacterized protein YbjT (DUF2867 family)
MNGARKILVIGASGLIGRFITDDLRAKGFQTVGVARKFSPGQATSAFDLELPILAMDAAALARLLRDRTIDVVVNCLGVLQDGPGSDSRAVHHDFVARLLQAIRESGRTIRLIHISIPGAAKDDHTAFSLTKREAERLITASDIPHAILRPGFVIAPAAYGGSAMVRALAALPFRLSAADASAPFQPVAIEDVSATIAWLAARDVDDETTKSITWDLMQTQPITLGEVIEAFRRAFGAEKSPRIPVPAFLLNFGVMLADLVSWLGWTPPMRRTAIAELRRGVRGDPSGWMAATGLIPKTITEILGKHSATIQDKWFARLYLIKALIFASLVVFWIASGFIALFISYDAAANILRTHAFPTALVGPVTILTSLMDMATGVLIAFRRTAAFGLVWGILASLGYMAGAAILTPDLWIEPLGALVKTGPAIVLMLVALLMLDSR